MSDDTGTRENFPGGYNERDAVLVALDDLDIFIVSAPDDQRQLLKEQAQLWRVIANRLPPDIDREEYARTIEELVEDTDVLTEVARIKRLEITGEMTDDQKTQLRPIVILGGIGLAAKFMASSHPGLARNLFFDVPDDHLTIEQVKQYL